MRAGCCGSAHPGAYPYPRVTVCRRRCDEPKARRSRRTALQPPGVGEGVLGVDGDNQVVEDADVDEPQRLREAPRQ
jgi:hypothetical protein